jgi:hypothetical protein
LRIILIHILAQTDFVVLVGLAAQLTTLIVEFARQVEEKGSDPVAAAVYRRVSVNSTLPASQKALRDGPTGCPARALKTSTLA